MSDREIEPYKLNTNSISGQFYIAGPGAAKWGMASQMSKPNFTFDYDHDGQKIVKYMNQAYLSGWVSIRENLSKFIEFGKTPISEYDQMFCETAIQSHYMEAFQIAFKNGRAAAQNHVKQLLGIEGKEYNGTTY